MFDFIFTFFYNLFQLEIFYDFMRVVCACGIVAGAKMVVNCGIRLSGGRRL